MEQEEDIRRLSLRMDESLASMVDELSRMDNRSFNSEVIELVKKGISLHRAERALISKANPVHIVNSVSQDDDASKHPSAPGSGSLRDEGEQKGEDRELA